MEPSGPLTRPNVVLDRRQLLRASSLAALAVATPGLLAACDGGARRDEGDGSGDGGTGASTMALVSSDVSRAAADPAAAGPAAASVQGLGGALYGRLAGARTSGNLALSPYSVAVALGMTANGAEGRTRTEMLSVLGATDVASLDAGLNALTAYVESLAGPVAGQDATIALDAANQLFGQRGVTWRRPFLDALAGSFGAGLRTVDYEHDTDAARADVNRWTADQTHGRIPTLVPDGVLDTRTRLVLVDTLYLKAPWAVPFPASGTRDGDFHLADGSVAQVPMMHAMARGTTARGDGWQSLRLPYAGQQLAMTLVLPDQGRLGDVESLVGGGRLAELLPTTGGGPVDLTLPSWTFRASSSLAGELAELGMPTAFGPSADFSGMTTEEPLQIDEVLQQVFVAVDEAGTEAAAATAVGMGSTAMPVAEARLVLDRPFLFVIHDVAHGTPLFLGRVADPRG